MEIVKQLSPVQTTLGRGSGTYFLSSPGKLKIHTTGGSAEVVLDDGPPPGKKWEASIQLRIVETDA